MWSKQGNPKTLVLWMLISYFFL